MNPLAGKDVRRLSSAAGHTSDVTKIGIVRRIVAAAAEHGVHRIVLMRDPHRLAERAVDGLDAPVEFAAVPVTGSRLDTATAARHCRDSGVQLLVVLGGDGTCRDVAAGWHDAPLVAVSTGTNNVFPRAHDGTSAGTAAAIVATGVIALERVAQPAKRVHVSVDGADAPDPALVELALVDQRFVGARAVTQHDALRTVVAAIASPSSTGLSSIPGRLRPVGRDEDHGVLVRLGPGGAARRAPLAPGTFSTVHVTEIRHIALGEEIDVGSAGVLAFDGERDLPLNGRHAQARILRDGPRLVDVERTLELAARAGAFCGRHATHHPTED